MSEFPAIVDAPAPEKVRRKAFLAKYDYLAKVAVGQGFPIGIKDRSQWSHVASTFNKEKGAKFKIVRAGDGLFVKREA